MATSTINTGNVIRTKSTLWGTRLTVTKPTDSVQLLFIRDANFLVVWFASTANLNIQGFYNGALVSVGGTGSVTLGDMTFVRNGDTLTITTGSYCAMKAFY